MKCEYCKGELWPMPNFRKRRVTTLLGEQQITVQGLKCSECGKWDTADHDLAPKGSKFSFDVIEYLVNDKRGHAELSRFMMREFGLYIPDSSIHSVRKRYTVK